MSGIIQAIPTEYGAIKFKSRLEARFAEWLDNNCLDKLVAAQWQYEPCSFGSQKYTPDFRLSWWSDSAVDRLESYFEIKPFCFLKDASLAIQAAQETGRSLMVVDEQGRGNWVTYATVCRGELIFYTAYKSFCQLVCAREKGFGFSH